MSTWSSRGLRGSTLEELINNTNEFYRKKKLALVQKIPTSITPVESDSSTKRITKAFFEKDSTVDYIGVVQEVPVCFDAKECHSDTFSLQNIHEHQYNFMKEFEEQGGVSFLIILFSVRNDLYYMPFKELKYFIERTKEGHAKNFKYNELNDDYFLKSEGGALVHYLKGLEIDLNSR